MTNSDRLREKNTPRVGAMHSVQIQDAYMILIKDDRFTSELHRILESGDRRSGYITDAELRIVYTGLAGTLMLDAALNEVMS